MTAPEAIYCTNRAGMRELGCLGLGSRRTASRYKRAAGMKTNLEKKPELAV